MSGKGDKETILSNYIRQRGQLKSETVERWGEFKTTAVEKKNDGEKRRSHSKTQMAKGEKKKEADSNGIAG